MNRLIKMSSTFKINFNFRDYDDYKQMNLDIEEEYFEN